MYEQSPGSRNGVFLSCCTVFVLVENTLHLDVGHPFNVNLKNVISMLLLVPGTANYYFDLFRYELLNKRSQIVS